MDKDNTNRVQHFYLRHSMTEAYDKNGQSLSAFKGPPVGVIAFQLDADGKFVRVAGSMVSYKDSFDKKTGVTKARGRLHSNDRSVSLPVEDAKEMRVDRLVDWLGLASSRSNYYGSVDWARATAAKDSALKNLETRTEKVPVT